MVASIISEIRQAQNSIFNFPKNASIISYLNYGLTINNEEVNAELSKKREPHSSLTPPEKRMGKEVTLESQNPIFGLDMKGKKVK